MQPQSPESRKVELRGLELMAQRGNLIYTAAYAVTAQDRFRALDALERWDADRTEEDEAAMRVAIYGRAGRRALVKQCDDHAPIGQRR